MSLRELKEEAQVRWLMAPQEHKQLLIALLISFAALVFNVLAIVIETRLRTPRTVDL